MFLVNVGFDHHPNLHGFVGVEITYFVKPTTKMWQFLIHVEVGYWSWRYINKEIKSVSETKKLKMLALISSFPWQFLHERGLGWSPSFAAMVKGSHGQGQPCQGYVTLLCVYHSHLCFISVLHTFTSFTHATPVIQFNSFSIFSINNFNLFTSINSLIIFHLFYSHVCLQNTIFIFWFSLAIVKFIFFFTLQKHQ